MFYMKKSDQSMLERDRQVIILQKQDLRLSDS